jgi:hypothetical protein
MQVELRLHLPQQLLVRLVQADPNDGVLAMSPLSGLFDLYVANAPAVLIDGSRHDAVPMARLSFDRWRVAIVHGLHTVR